MEHLYLLGVSQRRGGTNAIAAWSERLQPTAVWPTGVQEAVPILTCNRCDLVVALDDGVSIQGLRQRLGLPSTGGYAYQGEAAIEQLCRIAASLDSLNPGEDQIMAQVRSAFEHAQKSGYTGPTTAFTFQTALRVAKRVRREIQLSPAKTSLFSLVRPHFEALLPTPANVAIVGTGEMGILAARTLAARANTQLWLVNRSPDKALHWADQLGGQALSLANFLSDPPPQLHGLVSATPVARLLGGPFFAKTPHLQVVADLGQPPNVVGQELPLSVKLFDFSAMQDLGNRRRNELQGRLAQAEALVQQEVVLALAEWSERRLGPAIVQMREHYQQTLGELLGSKLDSGEIARVASRFSHWPIKGLRGLARTYGPEVALTFLREAGLGESEVEHEQSG